MRRVLDRSKEYGETFGDTADLKYFQDGIWFDVDGNEVGVLLEKTEKKKQKTDQREQQ